MINWIQSTLLEYDNADTLPIDVPESTRAYNISSGEKKTFVDGVWKLGWYSHYVTVESITLAPGTIMPSHMKGLPEDLSGTVGYYLSPDDDLQSWDLKPLPQLPTVDPVYLTWAQLVSRVASKDVDEGDIFRVTDLGNKKIIISHISLPGYYAWYETMSDTGQLTHQRIV
jgi:hypothetical protein